MCKTSPNVPAGTFRRFEGGQSVPAGTLLTELNEDVAQCSPRNNRESRERECRWGRLVSGEKKLDEVFLREHLYWSISDCLVWCKTGEVVPAGTLWKTYGLNVANFNNVARSPTFAVISLLQLYGNALL